MVGKTLATSVARAVTECFKDEKNRKAFEEWYRNEYGHEYQWKDDNEWKLLQLASA